MAREQARVLRERGIQAAKAGQKDQARQFLKQSIQIEPGSEIAWLWLASVARDSRERVFCLQKLLEINPKNETGLKALRAMGISPPSASSADISPTPVIIPPDVAREPAAPAPRAPAAPVDEAGIPIPDPQRLEDIQAEVDEIVQRYLAEPPDSPLRWVQKTRRRAGEGGVLILRLQVAGMILGFLAVAALVGVIFVASSPQAQALLFAPTWTISPTPTNTSTPTPGLTPTASPTLDTTREPTYTPSPTISLSITPGDTTRQPRPTELHLPLPPERVIIDAAALLDQGKGAEVLPTLIAERAQAGQSFDPNTYYYEALALAQTGDGQGGLRRLAEAEARLNEVSSDQARAYKTLLDIGVARISLQLAEEAFDEGDRQQALSFLSTTKDRAESVKGIDPEYADAYVMLARSLALEDQYDQAIQILNDGLSIPRLVTDLNLRVTKGQLYYEQGEYDLASQQAFEALYINPFSEPAHLLQIRAALALDQPGLAVIHAERYLFYYPGSILGFKLLGDARVAEGNLDQALEVYTRALTGDEDAPAYVDVLVARADLYSRQRRYDLAREDLTRALTLSGQPYIQALRMQAAYNAGNTATALRDADELRGKGALTDAELELMQARILIDRAGPEDTSDLQQGLALLGNAATLPPALQAVSEEYRARAGYLLDDYDIALAAITNALNQAETGSRRYLRGLILEARAALPDSRTQVEDLAGAIRDYEWVVTWGAVYPYSFFQDAAIRLERLKNPPEDPTPTPESA